ncbi:MAG: caspase family protein [Bacteroidota bacterium]|nr:caspase family protein [Bacteroidota bacterium]
MKKIVFMPILWVLFLTPAWTQEMGLKVNKEFGNLGDYVGCAQFSPFRNYFAYSLGNNTLRIFDRNWDVIFEHQGNSEAGSGNFAFSPDEKYMAYGRYRGKNDIAIIRLEDMKVMQVLNQHSFFINHLEFSHDGKWLTSCSHDGQMIIWKLSDDQYLFHQLVDEFESYLYQSSFSYNDRFLVTGDTYGNILVLERSGSGYEPFQRLNFRKHGVEGVVFQPEEYTFITGSSNGLRRYRLIRDAFALSDSTRREAYIRNPISISQDGNFLAYGQSRKAVISKITQDSIFPVDFVYRHMEEVLGAAFTGDGEFLLTYGIDQQVIIWEIDRVQPSDRSLVVSWLNSDLSLAQRRSLTPAAVGDITGNVDPELTLPRDEFETSMEYNTRVEKLADWSLMKLQSAMEKQYGVRSKSGIVEIPLQGLVGYNADLQIYKIRFMETEAGVQIPVSAARKFKEQWSKSFIRASKSSEGKKKSYTYSSFELYNSSDKKFYEVIPLENPFHPEEQKEERAARVEVIQGKDSAAAEGVGTTYALLFASNVYDYYSDLVNPVLDAQTIGTELSENYGVVSEVVINPTLSETASVIREFASRSYKPEDNLMIFFAGHGVYDEVFREGYVISRDSRTDDVGKTSYLSHSNLRTMINNIDCPHIFLVMDVCFGGTFDPHLAATHRGGAVQYADISTKEFVERKLKYKTRLYLTSGGKEYVPDGRPGFHSPFARRFIESLRYYGGDDGVLTTSEILQFVEKVNPQPRFGEFGDNEPGSDFILVVK